MSIEDDIRSVEEEIRNTQYNKATESHIGRLKAKLARLKDEAAKVTSKATGARFAVRKSGDATVVIVGPPSAGKSTLLNMLTGAHSPVGDYPFTTVEVIPGVFSHKGARIQVLDLPGLIEGAASGRGRGREILAVIRGSDLVLILLDVFDISGLAAIKRELHESGIRINIRPPDVTIKRTGRGGVTVSSTAGAAGLNPELIKSILGEYKIHNADVTIREPVSMERFIDALTENLIYIPGLVVLNKAELADEAMLRKCKKEIPDAFFISAVKGTNMDALKEELYRRLRFIRVYMKPQGGQADLNEPMILKSGATIGNACDWIHRDFRQKFRYALVWGKSVKHMGQHVGIDHRLIDGDVVTIITRK